MNKDLTKGKGREGAEDFVRPRVDVFENDEEILLVADVPGVAKDSVDVRYDDGNLTIEAKRTVASTASPLALEYRPANYRCAFGVPDGIDADKIGAKLEGGVLTVHLPKPAKRARRIDVQTA
jgi:HSP20 family protein